MPKNLVKTAPPEQRLDPADHVWTLVELFGSFVTIRNGESERSISVERWKSWRLDAPKAK